MCKKNKETGQKEKCESHLEAEKIFGDIVEVIKQMDKIYEEQNWMSKKVPTGINNKANRNGNVFHNADNLLPNKYDGYYREYYVMPKGHDGSKHQYRFVVGGMGEIYYTDNHYNSFVRLK